MILGNNVYLTHIHLPPTNKKNIKDWRYLKIQPRGLTLSYISLTLMSDLVSCLVFSTMSLWKYGWKRQTEPSTPIVTDFSSILLRSAARPADTRCADRLDTHSQMYRTLAQSTNDGSLMPISFKTFNVSLQLALSLKRKIHNYQKCYITLIIYK